MRQLQGAVAVVTGAASGIGAAVALRLAKRGAHVVVADLDTSNGQRVAREADGLFVRTDVSDLGANEDLLRQVDAMFGRLDVLHLNAGLSTRGMRLDAFDQAAYRTLRGVNLDGVVYGLVAALPLLKRQGGQVVITGSLSGLTPFPGDALYAATKTAVVGLARSLAEQLATDGITVNAICPGFTDTAIIADARDEFRRAGFPVLDPDDVAAVVERVVDGDETGQAWVVQPGRTPEPYRFRGVPGAVVGEAHQGPPEAVRSGEVLR